MDFFRGAPTLDAATGEWRRPWVFRMTLGHSRHGYEEAVWDQKLETFLRLHERAFRDLGGVPTVVRHDNLKAAVVRACFYDPDNHDVYLAFAAHWGFTPLPTQPRRPEENGKQERSGGYVKDNALKGRRFDSLTAQNAFLRHWNRTIARLRIHGTTRRQVWTHFVEVEQRALQPLAVDAFPYFASGERTVHTDGHVEVAAAFYPVRPPRAMVRTSCASSTATRSSWCMPGSQPACLRPAPERLRPRRVNKRHPMFDELSRHVRNGSRTSRLGRRLSRSRLWTGPLREFCTRCASHSGPSRAQRGRRYWQPASGPLSPTAAVAGNQPRSAALDIACEPLGWVRASCVPCLLPTLCRRAGCKQP